MNQRILIEVVQHFLNILSFFLGIYLITEVIRDRKNPGSTWGWLLIMVLIPYLGVPLYLTLGRRKLKIKATQKSSLYKPIAYDDTPTELSSLERLLLSSGGPKKNSTNKIETLLSGETTYKKMIHVLQNAKKSIWITTFILGNDSVGSEILQILTQQAQNGVHVCLLLDGLGSFWVPRLKLWKLKKAGGKISFFLPLIHIPFFGHSNLRNHRKLMIVDEKIALLGGMNLAEEYLGTNPDPKRWIDLSFSIEGEGVSDLSTIFSSDWKFASKSKLHRIVPILHQPSGSSSLQIVGSGPDVSGDPLYDSILYSIFSAQHRIWMATPYFIPDDTLAKALEIACRRGVDVRLIVPKKSNHLFADLCRGSYLRQLELAGGHIYFDLHTMMHAKVTLIDDNYAVVGSANMDMRSLLLNYEVGLFLYSQDDIQTISHWFLKLQHLAYRENLKRNFSTDFLDGLGRILGPML